jgi:hypothetical protein
MQMKRLLLASFAVWLAVAFPENCAAANKTAKDFLVYIGTYTTGKSKGI